MKGENMGARQMLDKKEKREEEGKNVEGEREDEGSKEGRSEVNPKEAFNKIQR